MNNFFSPEPFYQQTGIGILRIITGLLLVYHGIELFDAETMKVYTTWDSLKASTLLPYIGKAGELISGILLTIGLFTRPACIIIMATFIYITFFVGGGKFWYQDQHPFMFVLMSLVFIFTGPGNFSVDEWRMRHFKKVAA